VSGAGHIPLASGPASLGAAIGPMARSVEDTALLYRIIAGYGETESVHRSISDPLAKTDLRGCQVAWYTYDGVAPVTEDTRNAVESAARALENAGLKVREENPPAIERGHDLWSALFARASLVQMRSEYKGREDEAGPLVRHLLDSSTFSESPTLDEFARVWIERDQLRAALVEWMKDTPLIVAPVGAMAAYKHGTRQVNIAGQDVSIFPAFGYSQTYNVFDLPSVSVPTGLSEHGMPVGVQIIGRPFAEEHVLAAAKAVEQALGGWQLPIALS